jgi:hypothetical protein
MKILATTICFLAILSSCKHQPSTVKSAFEPSLTQKDIIFRQPSPYVLGFIGNDTIHLSSINHNSFRIYFRDTSYAASHLTRIKTELDTAFNRILSVLTIPKYPYGIYLLAVDSKDEMKRVMGYKIKGGAAQGHDLVFFVFNDSIRPQFRHEIFHLMSYETWGHTKYRLLDEGGATYTDNFCFYDNPMYSINAYFLKKKELFAFKDLINDFDNKAKENDVIAYIESAGIFKYLYENYGVEKMKLLWVKGFDQFEAIYGFSIIHLEKDWLNAMSKVPIPKDIDENKLMDQGCG